MDSSKKLFKFGDTTSEWHYFLDGAEYGPVDEAEVISLIENAEIPPGAPVCKKGEKEWKPAREHACFQVEVNPHRRDTGRPDLDSPESNPPSAANAGGQSSSAPVVPVIHVSGNPAGTSPGAGFSQPDLDQFYDTCKVFVVQAKAVPKWAVGYLVGLLSRGASLMRLGAWVYLLVLLVQGITLIANLDFAPWMFVGLLVQLILVLPFFHTRDGTMFPYALMLAILVLGLHLAGSLGIQPVVQYSYSLDTMSMSEARLFQDLVLTNIFLMVGAGLLACGAWTSREVANKNTTRKTP